MSLQLSVIIPVWNCWELTRNCLTSLREFTPGNFMQVLVVDNGSSDETPSHLPALGKQLFGQNFVHLRNEQNLGFAKACNQGAALAQAEMLFFLNNDTLLLKDWLSGASKNCFTSISAFSNAVVRLSFTITLSK